MNAERASFGALGFYFPGIPAVALSASLTACRSVLGSLVSAVRGWLLYFSPSNALNRLIEFSCSLVHSGYVTWRQR